MPEERDPDKRLYRQPLVDDDAAEWDTPYPEPVKPVTLEELLDYLTEQDMVESNSLQFGGDIPVEELLKRIGRK